MRLQDKVAIVTGGGAGIGRAIAESYAREGACVVIAEIDEARGTATEHRIRDEGGRALFLRTDTSDELQVRSMAERVLDQHGKIDVLCNNAAILLSREDGPAHELTNEAWDRTIAVNLRGYWLCSKYILPTMLRQQQGSVIHVASPTGMFGFTALTAYSASKGGVFGLMRSMAADYAPHSIRVNAIVPGTIDTPMNSETLSDSASRQRFADKALSRRIGEPQDVTGLAVFLASDESTYCVGGIFTVDGGLTAM